MECTSCKSKNFFKHSSGFLVCETCFTQAKAPEQKSDDFTATPRPLKRKLTNTIKKSKKLLTDSKIYIELSFEKYLEYYKSLLSFCIQSLITKLKVKKLVLNIALAVFDYYIPKKRPEFVLPKNRRKRKAGNPLSYPSNKFNFLSTISEHYGPDLSTKTLFKLCKGLGISSLNDKEISRAMCTLGLFSKINPVESLISFEQPIQLSNILVIIYVAMIYTYSETKAILAGDIIEWAYTGVLPYFTAYLQLPLSKCYVSLFKPLNLPSTSWLSKQIAQCPVDCIVAFRSFFPFIYHLCLHVTSVLELPKVVADLAFKLYLKSKDTVVCKINKSVLPEDLAIAHVISVIKLLYGLNDIPYVRDVKKNSNTLVEEESLLKYKNEKSMFSDVFMSLPSLSDLFTTFAKKIHQNSLTLQAFSIGNLDKYIAHIHKTTENPSDPNLLVEPDQKKKPVNTFTVNPLSAIKNQYFQEQIRDFQEKGSALIYPSSDFWVQKKKKKSKDYPFDYLFTVHCVASLCGHVSTKKLNFICDRIDRFIASTD